MHEGREITVKLKEIRWKVCEPAARGQSVRPHSVWVESPGKIWVTVGIFDSIFPDLFRSGQTRGVRWH